MPDRRFLRTILERGAYGAAAGAVYGWLDQTDTWQWVLLCASAGGLIGLSTSSLDYLLFLSPLRRQRFPVVLLVRTLSYLLVISLCVTLALGFYLLLATEEAIGSLLSPGRLIPWITGPNLIYYVGYSTALLLALQFIILVSRLLGPNVMLNYLLGRYHQPKEEERIFMFMDLRASTTIAERLGPMKWHKFLNDFFFDIAQPVRRNRGEIYQYVGDEVVISWPKAAGLRDCSCINCFFEIWDKMTRRRMYYIQTYGYEPIFKAGYHVGTVIVGEIGDYTRDIVFHGDTVNTASRIQAECNHFNRRLLLSDTLLRQLPIAGRYDSEYITKILLRGKAEELELYSLDPAKKR
ncbi:MAG: adenylate/guanylate cyclase domain-containing protein [Bacteroidia bacterium]|nr:adenylate/guanylate cyclase domain-containing protein [Bacteroidia bacterium]